MDEPLLNRGLTQKLVEAGVVEPEILPGRARPKKWWQWGGFVLADFLSPILGSAVLVPFAIGFVGIVVASNPGLNDSLPTLLASVLLSQGVSTLLFVAFSQHYTCTNIDLLHAAFLAAIGQTLTRYGVRQSDLIIHILVAQGLLSMCVGIWLLFLAKVNGLWYARFLPYPVSSGFVSGIGMIILDGGFELGCGAGIQQLVRLSLPSVVYAQMAATIVAGIIFLVIKEALDHYTWGGSVRLPLGLLAVSVLVHGGAHLADVGPEKMEELGLFLSNLREESWTASWELLAERIWYIDAAALFSQPCISLFVSYSLLSVFSMAFCASGMEEIQKSDTGSRVDLNREIQVTGWTLVATGAVAGVPCSHSLKVAIVMINAGGKTRMWVFLLGITYMFLYFDASVRSQLVVIPKCAFGGLVMSLGVEFVHGSLGEAYQRIAFDEWRFVVVTAILVYFNVLLGIFFGVMLTMIFFVVEYSGMTGITRQATLRDVRSLVERQPEENSILNQHGGTVGVFWCAGYIFFGTAASIMETIEEYIGTAETNTIIVDFEMVPAVDASGVHALTEFANRMNEREPPIAVIFTGLVRRLHMALSRSAQAKHLNAMQLSSKRVEETLEWAENEVLGRKMKGQTPKLKNGWAARLAMKLAAVDATAGEKQPITQSPMEVLEELMEEMAPTATPEERSAVCQQLASGGVEIRRHENKAALYKEGDEAKDMFYVVDGAVSLTRIVDAEEGAGYKLPRHHLNEEKGDVFVFEERTEVRVQRVAQGTVLGALEYAAARAAACRHPFEIGVVPRRATSACASPWCYTLRVPFGALDKALDSNKAVGYSVMSWLSQLSSSQVMSMLQGAHVRPFRLAGHDVPLQRAVSVQLEIQH